MKLKDLKINQVPFYYQLYEGEEEAIDIDGYLTGEKVIKYSAPIKEEARISPNTQDAQTMPFGVELQYDKAISTVKDLPIDEFSVLFIDTVPEYDEDGKLINKADYTVVKVAKDLQQKVWAVRKIVDEVDNGERPEPEEYTESPW